MDLIPAERELLNAAEQNARRALSNAREEAERILRDAHTEASELLIRQQQAAAILLLQYADAEEHRQIETEAEASSLPETEGAALRRRGELDAEELLLIQQRAADMLLQAQKEVSEKLAEALERAVADALLAGQREAAALLLEARTRIEVDRAAKTRAP